MDFDIDIGFFEGPLDLLLYLVRKDEIDVKDIEISRITRHYIDVLEVMKDLDLNIAGEFLVMASTLLRLKANELLPKEMQEPVVVDGEEIDKEALIRQIKEYELYRNAASEFKKLEEENMGTFPRGLPEEIPSDPELENKNYMRNISIYDLLLAFKNVLEKPPSEHLEISGDSVSIDDRIESILDLIENEKKIPFDRLFRDDHRRIVMVVTFMALLELIKLQMVVVFQAANFEEIWVYSKKEFENIDSSDD
ncbi:MAG: segregation and condensation protein A [Fibrobacterota bacterium]